MKIRLIGVGAVSVALALTVTSAEAATPTLDGKKVKTLSLTTAAGVQDHDTDLITDAAKNPAGAGPDRAICQAPRCSALTFLYKPAKGVPAAPVGFKIAWGTPGDDFDLYVAEVTRGERSTLAKCGATAGTSETVIVPAGTLKAGHTYALVADHYRSVSDKVTATVSFPNTFSAKTTVPAAADAFGPVNCGM
jgi:hypothetical protein